MNENEQYNVSVVSNTPSHNLAYIKTEDWNKIVGKSSSNISTSSSSSSDHSSESSSDRSSEPSKLRVFNPFSIMLDATNNDRKFKFNFNKRRKNMNSLINWFVVDPNEHVAEDKAILAKGTSILRDQQEFLIGLNIPEMLKKYNEYRVTVEYDHTINDNTVTKTLKPARIRDIEIIFQTIKELV